jgi:hypothetical protein
MGSVGAAGKSAGLNIWQYLREQDQEVKNQLGQKLLTPTLLSGSPRVLALCCPGDAAERPLESLLNGLVNERNSNEVCKCKLAVEPEMQSFSNFVPEFLWIGPDDDVPGLQLYPIVKPLQQTTSVRLQDINVRFPIEIDQFETMFTDRLREQFEAVKGICK